MQLNDVGKKNGVVDITVDGESKIRFDQLYYRSNADLKAQALVFATWFGGGDSSWAPTKDMQAYFKNIKIYEL